MMDLQELMDGIAPTERLPKGSITGISYDSRTVKTGHLFAALPGVKNDGNQYIPQAIERGAAAIVGDGSYQVPLTVPYYKVASPRQALAQLAARFYGDPTRDHLLLGVTGTNGKTTCTHLITAILAAAGHRPALVGTIEYRLPNGSIPAPLTTPESVDLQAFFATALTQGADSFVMEASSHGIAMDRTYGCHFDGAAFTNLSQDHLDYHETMEEYYQAKAALFTKHLPASQKKKRFVVLNWEDAASQRLAKEVTDDLFRCGWDDDLEYCISNDHYTLEGLSADIETPDGPITIKSHLLGRFNLINIILAVALCHQSGIALQDIVRGIAQTKAIPGRLERVGQLNQASIYVDYAHTPDALLHVLAALRPLTTGRLITVFGCGGDRDRTKRPQMGQAAANSSDLVIVTSDNPRTEDPTQIINDILPGVESVKKDYHIESDRRIAIRHSLEIAQPNDVILIAGKGHEDYQIIGTEKQPFDDRLLVREFCEELA